ncbi:hypothetical protein QL285_084316 [Trifolium repens]|nr:hypothetical protein QL285_084316 [Trifolium repens]
MSFHGINNSSPAAAVEPSRFVLLPRYSFLCSPAVRLGRVDLWWSRSVLVGCGVLCFQLTLASPRWYKFGGPKGRWWRCHTPLLCVSKSVRVGSVLLPVVVGSFSTYAAM